MERSAGDKPLPYRGFLGQLFRREGGSTAATARRIRIRPLPAAFQQVLHGIVQFEAIQKREAATIRYPDDGNFVGDWKKGERLAQSGYGLRFTDYPPRNPNGGNCFACHQMTRQEVSYGTIGPSLLGYGKARGTAPEALKTVYEKIYNPHATFACSLMPRFGTNKVLTVEQIKDLVALLMDPASPVNQ